MVATADTGSALFWSHQTKVEYLWWPQQIQDQHSFEVIKQKWNIYGGHSRYRISTLSKSSNKSGIFMVATADTGSALFRSHQTKVEYLWWPQQIQDQHSFEVIKQKWNIYGGHSRYRISTLSKSSNKSGIFMVATADTGSALFRSDQTKVEYLWWPQQIQDQHSFEVIKQKWNIYGGHSRYRISTLSKSSNKSGIEQLERNVLTYMMTHKKQFKTCALFTHSLHPV